MQYLTEASHIHSCGLHPSKHLSVPETLPPPWSLDVQVCLERPLCTPGASWPCTVTCLGNWLSTSLPCRVELQEGSTFISQGACPHELVPHLAPLINTLILLKGKGWVLPDYQRSHAGLSSGVVSKAGKDPQERQRFSNLKLKEKGSNCR